MHNSQLTGLQENTTFVSKQPYPCSPAKAACAAANTHYLVCSTPTSQDRHDQALSQAHCMCQFSAAQLGADMLHPAHRSRKTAHLPVEVSTLSCADMPARHPQERSTAQHTPRLQESPNTDLACCYLRWPNTRSRTATRMSWRDYGCGRKRICSTTLVGHFNTCMGNHACTLTQSTYKYTRNVSIRACACFIANTFLPSRTLLQGLLHQQDRASKEKTSHEITATTSQEPPSVNT